MFYVVKALLEVMWQFLKKYGCLDQVSCITNFQLAVNSQTSECIIEKCMLLDLCYFYEMVHHLSFLHFKSKYKMFSNKHTNYFAIG